MLKERESVKDEDQWSVDKIFLSLEEASMELESMQQLAGDKENWPQFYKLKGKLSLKENLKSLLDQYYDIERKLVKIYTYAHLKFDENITQRHTQELFEKTRLMINQFKTANSWVIPEILQLDEALFEAINQDPLFADYIHFFRQLTRVKPFTLSEKEEYILSLSSNATHSISKTFNVLDGADLEFEDCKNKDKESVPLSHGLYGLYMQSEDRELRKTAFNNLHAAYKKHENTFCELLSGQVQTHYLSTKARGYDSCMHAALNENEVDTAVYTNLIKSIKNRASSLHAYTKHRKEVLGVDELFAYDLQVPLTKASSKTYTYEEAEDLVLSSIKTLGSEYVEIATRGMKKEGWVDRYENKNKRSGAYSSGCFDSHPYILMNFNGSLTDVFTLAHELGHSMHSYYSNKARNYIDSGYSIFVAEVASTFNEQMLLKTLMGQTQTLEERRKLIYFALERIRATLFRQTQFAEFELKIHELIEQGQPLSASLLEELYVSLNKEYYGPDLTIGEGLPVECFRIPHFYYNFYVYQYATGVSAAFALYDKVLEGGDQAKKKYLTFLQSGSTSDPVTLLERAGVSMRGPEAIDAIIDHFDSLLKQLS